jgi:hypothetical protein
MDLPGEDVDLSEPKTLKVGLPTRIHLKLHSVKILTGQNISDTVEAAVEHYFENDLDREVPIPDDFE